MPAGNLQYERRGPFEATKEVFLQVVYLENLSKDFENNPNFATPRSVPSTIRSKTTVFPKRAVSCPGTPCQNKVKPFQSLFKPTISSVPEQEQEPQGVSNQSTPASTMKKKKTLGSDVSLNRQISPALQTSHVFFADEDIPSPSVDSSFALPDDMLRKEAQKPWFVGPMTSGSTTPTTVLGPDEQILPSPDQPSPPAPSLVPSSELSPKRKVSPEREVNPVASGDCDESNLKGTSPSTGETTTSSTIPESTRRKSKFASIGSFLPSFSQSRRESIASFFKGARDLPSRLFKKSSKSTSPSPPQLRSTFKFTEKDTLPPKKIPLAKWQKAAKRRDKIFKIKSKWENLTSSGRVHRETRRRLSKEKEWKEYRAKLTGTQKLLAIMDDAKDKAWEWIDKRAEKKRREKLNAYKTMRDERRKSIVLVPVYRDYEIVARRESSYSGFGYTPEGSD
ncbi:hypothetical protein TWF102_002285 [Orbilia oligospora]|uniref:Uncharacterized protein n=1 Tax=Orbilia oligospora TaxID=2813651 RepID=A0A7C8JP72_ORBOL|nr:hypothetical protein TWF102_002285 [Orbilia oligospora]